MVLTALEVIDFIAMRPRNLDKNGLFVPPICHMQQIFDEVSTLAFFSRSIQPNEAQTRHSFGIGPKWSRTRWPRFHGRCACVRFTKTGRRVVINPNGACFAPCCLQAMLAVGSNSRASCRRAGRSRIAVRTRYSLQADSRFLKQFAKFVG
jgi:hypothetical protein